MADLLTEYVYRVTWTAYGARHSKKYHAKKAAMDKVKSMRRSKVGGFSNINVRRARLGPWEEVPEEPGPQVVRKKGKP